MLLQIRNIYCLVKGHLSSQGLQAALLLPVQNPKQKLALYQNLVSLCSRRFNLNLSIVNQYLRNVVQRIRNDKIVIQSNL